MASSGTCFHLVHLISQIIWAVDVAPTPGMPPAFTRSAEHQALLDHPERLIALNYDILDATNAFEALVAAVLDDAPFIVSSSNASYVPRPDVHRTQILRPRADLRMGLEDPRLWPQFYCNDFPHLAWILKEPPESSPSLGERYWVAWVDPEPGSHWTEDGAFRAGFGRASVWFRHGLSDAVEGLHEIASADEELPLDARALPEGTLHQWRRIILTLYAIRDALIYQTMSFRCMHLRDFQWIVLDLLALWMYCIKGLGVLSGKKEIDPDVATGVAHGSLMGCFTFDMELATRLKFIGAPVWVVRPLKFAGTLRVEKVSSITEPTNVTTELDKNSPVLWEGGVGQGSKILALRNLMNSRVGSFPLPFEYDWRGVDCPVIAPSAGSSSLRRTSGSAQGQKKTGMLIVNSRFHLSNIYYRPSYHHLSRARFSPPTYPSLARLHLPT